MAKNLDFWYKIAYKKNLRVFSENPASTLFLLYRPLTSCQKSEKSLEPFSRTFTDGRTNYNSKIKLNCKVLKDLLNLETFHDAK